MPLEKIERDVKRYQISLKIRGVSLLPAHKNAKLVSTVFDCGPLAYQLAIEACTNQPAAWAIALRPSSASAARTCIVHIQVFLDNARLLDYAGCSGWTLTAPPVKLSDLATGTIRCEIVVPAVACCPAPLANDTLAMLDSGLFSDVTLLVDDVGIPAHKAILVHHSPVFKAMFEGKHESCIPIDDVSPQVLRPFLRFALLFVW